MVTRFQEERTGPALAPDVHGTSLKIFLFTCAKFRCSCSNFSLSFTDLTRFAQLPTGLQSLHEKCLVIKGRCHF